MTGNHTSADPHRLRNEWVCVVLGAVAVVVVLLGIDLTPQVESEFFFSREDPQLRALEEMDRRFPTPEQVIIRARAPDIRADTYVSAVRSLTTELEAIPGVTSVASIATEDASRSPLWSRLLLNPGGSTTNLIVQIPDPDPTELTAAIETVLERFLSPDFSVEMSGVPVIVELIRRNLFRDLVVFSSTAFILFALVIGLVYRNGHIVLGMSTACLTACAVTLSITHIFDVTIGLLTANIAVIVFVLTLSHTVFLTANWKRVIETHADSDGDPATSAVALTIAASFWCMLTTLLGFVSLLVASANPLRELGLAGAIGALTAIVVAYGIYPTFLRASVSGTKPISPPRHFDLGARLPVHNGSRWLTAIGVVVLIAAVGFFRLSTDPGLLSYFEPGSELRDGLETIDKDGGSSPLNIAVRDPEGNRVDTDRMNQKMWTLQERLEGDSSVGVTISPAVVLAHAKTVPFGNLMSWSQLLDILESPLLDRAGLSFVTPDREQGRFFLRMRESGRVGSRAEIIGRMSEHVTESGLEVALMAGHYELQNQLGKLIGSSLRIGLGGLLLLFVGIAFVVSRSRHLTVAMVLCLCGIPITVLGIAGHIRMPIDIITSPAANVALAMGVDSMIHLVMRVRRLNAQGYEGWTGWLEARMQMWRPVLGATFIICAGFGIFSLSTFPPTQRFGFAVILGTVTAATMALVALPFAATVKLREPGGMAAG